MKKVGITGGIGSGKTMACKVFESLGVPVYYSDVESKRLLDEDEEVKRKIVRHFGKEVLNEEGRVDRKKMAALVFTNKKELEVLNKIMHPAVERDFVEWVRRQKRCKYVMKEAAILFESGANKLMDEVIVVTAPVNVRIERVMKRDRLTKEEVKERMKNQWTDGLKIYHSEYVIKNGKDRLMIPQVMKIHKKVLGPGKGNKQRAAK